MKRLELYQLEAFVMVVKHRSFSRAAENLFLSQPTISAHIKSLEKELGTALFDRGKSELILTPAAQVLYRYAHDLLALRAKAVAEILEKNKVGEEEITLLASSVPCQYLLPQVLEDFKKLYPGVSIVLIQQNSEQVCQEVHQYNAPLGVVGEQAGLSQLKFEYFNTDELVLAIPCTKEYKSLLAKKDIMIDDLISYTFLLREQGSGTRAHLETELAKAGQVLNMSNINVFGNQETIKQAVRKGLGLTVISKYVVEDYEQFGLVKLRSLNSIDLTRHFYIVYHEKRVLSPASRALLAYLRKYYSQEVSS